MGEKFPGSKGSPHTQGLEVKGDVLTAVLDEGIKARLAVNSHGEARDECPPEQDVLEEIRSCHDLFSRDQVMELAREMGLNESDYPVKSDIHIRQRNETEYTLSEYTAAYGLAYGQTLTIWLSDIRLMPLVVTPLVRVGS